MIKKRETYKSMHKVVITQKIMEKENNILEKKEIPIYARHTHKNLSEDEKKEKQL